MLIILKVLRGNELNENFGIKGQHNYMQSVEISE